MAMSTTYNSVARQSALRVNALVGAQVTPLADSYNTVPLTVMQWKSADFTFVSLLDGILLAEEKLSHAIANTGNHPWRAVLTSTTASVADEGALPSVDANSNQIIGIWGSVYDASNGNVCRPMPLEVIQRIVANSGSRYLLSHYYFKIEGQRIYHTRTGVKLDCCVYNRTTQQTAINTLTSNMLLPDVLEEALICGTVSYMVRDNAFMEQASKFRDYLNETINWIAQGLTSVPAKTAAYPEAA